MQLCNMQYYVLPFVLRITLHLQNGIDTIFIISAHTNKKNKETFYQISRNQQKFGVFNLIHKVCSVQSQFKDQITGLLELVEMSIINYIHFSCRFVLLFKLISTNSYSISFLSTI